MPLTTFAEGNIPGSFPGGGDFYFVAAPTRRVQVPKLRNALGSWTKLVQSDPNPVAHDPGELANLALRRWNYYRAGLEIASSLSDLRARIQSNPNAEVAVLLLAKAPALRDKKVRMGIVGVSLFRRTWANNIYLDMLARHPYAPSGAVGTAFLWYISRIADVIGAKAIWGETTQNSVKYYRKIFGTELSDLLYIRRRSFRAFCRKVEKRTPKK